jgi:RNA polymerase sigma-70 factor, ECF subfamily
MIQAVPGSVWGAMETVALASVLPRFTRGVRRFGGFGRRATSIASWPNTHRSNTPMPLDNDQTEALGWIAAIATRRDHAAFAALFGRYAPRIKGFLVRTGTAAEVAEEIAQEAMLVVWRKAALFDASRASVSTWIYTVARNLRIDRARHERVANAEVFYDVLKGDDPERPDNALESVDRDDRVRVAMKGLPGEQMTVVQLSFFEDKAHGDIARMLGIPLGTVKSRLRLAMAKLRERLDELA